MVLNRLVGIKRIVRFAGLMVNAILRPPAIIIKIDLALVYGRLMARLAQTPDKKPFGFEERFENRERVLDADFETVVADPQPKKSTAPLMPDTEQSDPNAQKADKLGMSVFGKKPAKPKVDDKIAFYGFGTILVALSFWVSGGHSLFRNVDPMPVSAIKDAKGSSEIADAAWRVVTVNGQSALHVEGIVRNSGAVAVHAKPMIVTVKLKDGAAKRYLLGQKGWTLGPSQEVVVSGRLDIASSNIASVVIELSD